MPLDGVPLDGVPSDGVPSDGVPAGGVPLWLGSYPAAGAGTPVGRGEGIWRAVLDPADGSLTALGADGVPGAEGPVVATPAPSFLALHPGVDVLYAVGEAAEGTVTAFAVEGHALRPLSTVAAGGADPCHLLVVEHEGAHALLVATYTGGTLAVLPLADDGRFAPAVLAAGGPTQVHGTTGSGPRADRQEAPHAHFVARAPGGAVLAVDLGTDTLRRFRVRRGAEGLVVDPDGTAAVLPPGTGPRHLAVTPDGACLLVVGELDGRLHVLAWDAATSTGRLLGDVPLVGDAVPTGVPSGVPGGAPGGAAPDPLPSHVTLVDGTLTVGVRGAGPALGRGPDDVLVHRRVDAAGDAAAAALLAAPAWTTALPGAWPRHHAVLAGWTVVALQHADAVVAVRPGGAGGADAPGTDASAADTPAVVGGRLAVPAPACVVVGR
ncbi:lactonase family protein [Cellulomonas marina]|uniref:Lactonase, 7-bladed beta-propeller n=1 Tax=Cellulomonas marina TaxID=988821 RepID=A0A1I0WNJ9_9CELL|nr:beta-propeller fold lactonase family protein [Cellulomonas marina]GIG27735.1 hypothetical protein Cma02nite_03350 [Cellulomonas marina]SFA89573.1 Lactonase, 7-bladed beta-propeller [Cellulomonas marina]